jgi:hypothetical protein
LASVPPGVDGRAGRIVRPDDFAPIVSNGARHPGSNAGANYQCETAGSLLDPDLSVVGLILLAVGVFMFATFWLLAYRAFARNDGPEHRPQGMRK